MTLVAWIVLADVSSGKVKFKGEAIDLPLKVWNIVYSPAKHESGTKISWEIILGIASKEIKIFWT